MRTTASFSERQRHQIVARLEKQYQSQPSRLSDAIKRAWQATLSFLTGRSEPRIQQLRDRNGNEIWRVYDPTTHQSTHFSSESEVRVWLEQRYYQ